MIAPLLSLCLLLAVPGCEEIGRFVYRIALYSAQKRLVGFGTGFFLAPDGTFVTARHVLEDARGAVRTVVEVRDGADCPVEKVLVSSPESDIAIVRVRLGSARVEVPAMADSVRPGEPVRGFRAGPPIPKQYRGAGEITCTTGQVVSVGPKQIDVRGWFFFVPGSSGSPVFNAAGQVVGVALEMVNWAPAPRAPDWSYTSWPIARVRALWKGR